MAQKEIMHYVIASLLTWLYLNLMTSSLDYVSDKDMPKVVYRRIALFILVTVITWGICLYFGAKAEHAK